MISSCLMATKDFGFRNYNGVDDEEKKNKIIIQLGNIIIIIYKLYHRWFFPHMGMGHMIL